MQLRCSGGLSVDYTGKLWHKSVLSCGTSKIEYVRHFLPYSLLGTYSMCTQKKTTIGESCFLFAIRSYFAFVSASGTLSWSAQKSSASLTACFHRYCFVSAFAAKIVAASAVLVFRSQAS
jgi:hypothetical protein